MSKTLTVPQTIQRPPCPDCGGTNIIAKGLSWKCKSCGRFWRKNPKVGIRKRPVSGPVICKDCGKLKKHYGKGLCHNCYQKQWAHQNLRYRHIYLGWRSCPKDGRRGEIQKTVITNKKTGNQRTRYSVRHEVYNKARYKTLREQGLTAKKAKQKATLLRHCTDISATKVKALGLTP